MNQHIFIGCNQFTRFAAIHFMEQADTLGGNIKQITSDLEMFAKPDLVEIVDVKLQGK